MSLIVVTGVTGTQGGSVARQLAKDPTWKVRGLTRNVNSAKAKELEALGIEIVAADLNDATTLPKAFEGATAVFCVTFFWHIATTQGIDAASKGEIQQFINVAHAVADLPNLKHLVLSVLPNCEKLSGGKLPCAHWDAKAQGGEYVKRELPRLAAKTTYVWVGWYVDNLVGLPLMQPQPYLGKYILAQASKHDAIRVAIHSTSISTGVHLWKWMARASISIHSIAPAIT